VAYLANALAFGLGDPFEEPDIKPPQIPVRLIDKAVKRLAGGLGYEALDELRRLVMDTAVTAGGDYAAAQAVVGFAHKSELRAVFRDLVGALPAYAKHLPWQNRVVTMDARLRLLRPYAQRAFAELHLLGAPRQYTDLLQEHMESPSFVHRVAAMCAVLLLAALLLSDQE